MGASLIQSLRSTIDRVLGPLLARTHRVALLDFPAHANVGDSAIWLGTLAYLRAAGKTVCYTCDNSTYSRAQLAARLGDGVILLSGGGNFGDIWKHSQRLREQVVRDFPHSQVVQLPQSIMFRDEREVERARATFDAHPSLTLLVRDRRSLRFASENFRATSLLCPDMAFCLGRIDRPVRAAQPIVWLARTDRERGTGAPPNGVPSVDWLDEPATAGLLAERFLRELAVERPRAGLALRSTLSRLEDRAARARLRRGCTMLSNGQVVITDRLHAHILSLLLGIPNTILDNSYGKLRDFYETWTSESELARRANDPDHAIALAGEAAP
jgi:exopolysaccharide biosynthesis predicted pyruvyltransferase EpsI